MADFPGVTGNKRRPAVVISSDAYHTHRPDVILGAITTNLTAASTPMDCSLVQWSEAGPHRPSAFRAFLVTLPRAQVLAVIGRLSDDDWSNVKDCVRRAEAL